MKQNNWVTCDTPIDVYRVSSKGIRHIRTIIPGEKAKHEPKPKQDEDKRKKSD